jgi:hypothetical protein
MINTYPHRRCQNLSIGSANGRAVNCRRFPWRFTARSSILCAGVVAPDLGGRVRDTDGRRIGQGVADPSRCREAGGAEPKGRRTCPSVAAKCARRAGAVATPTVFRGWRQLGAACNASSADRRALRVCACGSPARIGASQCSWLGLSRHSHTALGRSDTS